MLKKFTFFRIPIFLIASIAIGIIGWGFSDNPILMLLSLAVLPLWFHASNRFHAWLIMLVYFLAASRGLPEGTAVYFSGTIEQGIKVWFMANVWVSLPFLLWFKSPSKRTVGMLSALLLIAIPPFGFSGWAHPLLGIGFLWHGGGFYALILILLGLAITVNKYPWVSLIPLFIAGFIPQQLDSTKIDNWAGVDTNFKDNVETFEKDFIRQSTIINKLNLREDNPELFVLPETIAGVWLGGNDALWRSSYVKDQPVLLGATILVDKRKDSVVVMASKKGSKIVYTQRQPVPFSMWIPFKENTYRLHLLDSKPTVEIMNKRVAFLVCYEQLLMYPMLQSSLSNPDYIIGMSNSWWAANTSIPTIQRNMVYAWSRLFDIPYLYVENI